MSFAPSDSAVSCPHGQPAATPVTVDPVKPRVALWDNARFVLIVLVVIGHAISTVRTDGALAYGLYSYIYLFHMPAMVFLAGLFSKPEATPKAVKAIVQLLAVWVLWEGLWALVRLLVGGKELSGSFLVSPAWTLWFLVTLATMRILLPSIARLRHPLVFSIVLALAAGLSPSIGTAFSVSRTLCFLPFFVAAWLVKERGVLSGDWFVRPSRALRGIAWSGLGTIALVFVLVPQLRNVWRIDTWLTWREDYAWLFESAPLGAFGPSGWWGVALGGVGVRAVLLAVAAVMTLSLLLVVSRHASITTVWGTRTLYVYLLHGPVIWLLRENGAIEALASWGAPGVLVTVALGAAIAVVLSMGWVTRVFKPIIEPGVDWMLTRR